MVMAATDPVHHRIAQLHVLVLHVDLGAQHPRAVGELSGAHPSEQIEVLLDTAIAVRRLDAGFAVAAALGPDRVAVLVVDVGLAVVDQQLRPLVDLLEVVAGVQRFAGVVAEPRQVGDDPVDVRRILGVGIGVVEAQIAHAAELAGELVIERDRLGVPDVEVAVRLGWEPGLDAPAERPLLDVALHQLADEVGGARAVVVG